MHPRVSRRTLGTLGQVNPSLQEGDMGPMYGFQWRYFGATAENKGIDQLREVIELLIRDPSSRRIMMTSYNPNQVKQGCLYPCHGISISFNVEADHINLLMHQRSGDWFLGVPFNIASYAALLHIITNMVNNSPDLTPRPKYHPGTLVIIFTDAHLYESHFEAARSQLERQNMTHRFPHFVIDKQIDSLDALKDLTVDDMRLIGYRSENAIKANMVV